MFYNNLDSNAFQPLNRQILLGTPIGNIPSTLFYSNMAEIQKGINPLLTVDKKDETGNIFIKRIRTNTLTVPTENYILITCKGRKAGKLNGTIQVPKSQHDFFKKLAEGTGCYILTKNGGNWNTILFSVPKDFNTIIRINYSGISRKTSFVLIYNNDFLSFTYTELFNYFSNPLVAKISHNAFESLLSENGWVNL